VTALGGRAAEELVFGEVSTGAQNDLERITESAYAIVTRYGMNNKVGQVSFKSEGEYNFTKMYSDSTAQLIDEEVRKIIADAYIRTKDLLKKHYDALEAIAQELLEKEVIFKDDLTRLIGERPFPEHNFHPELKPKESEVPQNGAAEDQDNAPETAPAETVTSTETPAADSADAEEKEN